MAQKIPNKTGEIHEKIMSIIICTLPFLILRSCSMCIRGSRSLQQSELVDDFAIWTCWWLCNCLQSIQMFVSWANWKLKNIFLNQFVFIWFICECALICIWNIITVYYSFVGMLNRISHKTDFFVVHPAAMETKKSI